MLKKSIELSVDNMERFSHEVTISRDKKVQKMKRVVELINHFVEEDFIEQAEKEIGYEIVIKDWEFEKVGENSVRLVDNKNEEDQCHNRVVYDKSIEIEKSQWKEICQILQGQDIEDYYDLMKLDTEKSEDIWDKWFDGSGSLGWWY